MTELLRTDADLLEGPLVERLNRFVLAVDLPEAGADGPREVYLPETGRLTTVLTDDATVVCEPVEDPDRRTDFTALAVHTGEVYVTVEAVRANALVAAAIERGLLPAFRGWAVRRREPPLPDGGRADLLLAPTEAGPGGDTERYVEVKAVTHAEDGVAKFPDAPTERGRRHLRTLTALAEDGRRASVVLAAMRPDAEVVRPFREIDPEFADALAAAEAAGVDVRAVGTAFAPPAWSLVADSLPVELV